MNATSQTTAPTVTSCALTESADTHPSILVSIITPAFNAEKFVPRLARCVLGQTLRNIEWIFVDDCSRDRTHGEISKLSGDPRLRVIRHKRNRGVSASRNTGLEMAKGKYVCFLDADDSWAADKLQLQYEFMEEQLCTISYMNYSRVNASGQTQSVVYAPHKLTFEDLLVSNRIGNLTAMVRRDAVSELRFKEVGHEDYLYWLQALKCNASASRVPDGGIVRCFYTVSLNSLSGNKVRAIAWQWRIYRRELNCGILKSSILFINYAVAALAKRL